MLFSELARVSRSVAATPKRSEKIALLADVLRHAPPSEIRSAVAFITGSTLHGRVGVGWATLSDVRPPPVLEPTLTISDVDWAIEALAADTGPGSVNRRQQRLHDVMDHATEPEQQLIRSILGGEFRQGALDGVVTAAVAKAAGVPLAELQRAAMFAGSLPNAAEIALTTGAAGLQAVQLTPSRPIQPMLAAPAPGIAEALAATGQASVEWKLDGARIQAHRSDGIVHLYTRNLNEVTDRLGGVVQLVEQLPGGDLVLDGEVLGVDDSGAPRRFQDTMGDFGATTRGGTTRGHGLQAFFFDVLHVGTSVIDEPLAVRRQILASIVPEQQRLPSIITADPIEAEQFLARAIDAGHEGVMVKDLTAAYDAGRRGGAWRKVKPVHTLDLVVIAVEWGHGRRHGWLSNLHLAARGTDGEWVMVGKTFKGLTDDMLRWQTQRFLELKIGEGTGTDGHVVYVQPAQVVEIALDGVQVSSRYPGGVALRFARVRQYRHDKPPTEADTIERVQALLR